MRDSRATTDQSEDIDTHLAEEQKVAARRVICGYAQGDTLAEQVVDAEELMMALGVHPSQVDEDDYVVGMDPGPLNRFLFVSNAPPGVHRTAE
jgi:hypothetical protein